MLSYLLLSSIVCTTPRLDTRSSEAIGVDLSIMENPEAFLQELEEFNRSENDEGEKAFPEIFENYIEHVSKTGSCLYPWHKIKKIYTVKLNSVLANLKNMFVAMSSSVDNFNTSSYSAGGSEKASENEIQILKERIVERMESFMSAPFTIQRISELLLKPNSHYNRADKFLRGLEKCIMVVTTVDPYGNKIFVENYQTNGVSRSPSPSITPKRPATPVQDANNKPDEMSVQNTPQQFINDQTIPVVDSSFVTTCMVVKSTIISNEDDDDGGHHHRGAAISIQMDETETTTMTSVVLGQTAVVETSELVKETHIEVDQPKPSEHGTAAVEMQVEVDETTTTTTTKRTEKHAHPSENAEPPSSLENDDGDEAMEIEKKKLRLSTSDSEEPATTASDTAQGAETAPTDN